MIKHVKKHSMKNSLLLSIDSYVITLLILFPSTILLFLYGCSVNLNVIVFITCEIGI